MRDLGLVALGMLIGGILTLVLTLAMVAKDEQARLMTSLGMRNRTGNVDG